MNGSRARSVGTLLGLVLLAAFVRPAVAVGNPVAESEALIRQGLQLRAQGKPGKALPILEKAYQTSRSARTAAHLGLVELELGYFVEAERYLTEALESPDHPWISKNKPTLSKQLEEAKAGIGELVVAGSPAGAEIWVNGNRAGQLPLAAPLRLDKGRVDVQLRAPGHLAKTESLIIVGGKREQRSYLLDPDPAVARAPATPDPAGSDAPTANAGTAAVVAAPAAPAIEAAPSPASNHGPTLRTSAWIAGGLALGALAFGTYEVFETASARDAFNNHMGMVGGQYGRDCGTGALSPDCKPLKDAHDRAVTLSVVGFAAAGALAAGAAVLFLVSSRARPAAEPVSSARAFVCAPNVWARGLTCSLRF